MKLNKKNFLKFINKNFLFENNPSIAVAVSGGPDSMALLFLLLECNDKIKAQITVLIINHNLRNDSLEEANKVFLFLKNFRINTKIISVKKSNVNKRNMNEARNNRYRLLTNFCNKNNILYLFVGHQKDDNLETFVNRKIAGSDFEGLNSIKEISVINKTLIIRPLLSYVKKNIYNYNIKNKIPFIEDPSNTNLNYTRSVIRKFIGESKESSLKEITSEFENIKKNSKYYDTMINELFIENVIFSNSNYLELNFIKIKDLDKLLLEKIIKIIYGYLFSKDEFLRSKKVQIFISQLKKRQFKLFNLKGMVIKKVNNSLIFAKKLY